MLQTLIQHSYPHLLHCMVQGCLPPLRSPQYAGFAVQVSQNVFPLSVLGLHKVRHGLGLLVHVLVVTVTVIVTVSIILWSNVLHLVHATALWAALNRAFARGRKPDDNVRVDWVTSAAEVLLVTERLDSDGVLKGSYISVRPRSLKRSHATGRGGMSRTLARSIQWLHVEDIDSLHLSKNFETFETGSLLQIGGNGTWFTARWQKIVLALELCAIISATALLRGPQSALSLHFCSLTIERSQEV